MVAWIGHEGEETPPPVHRLKTYAWFDRDCSNGFESREVIEGSKLNEDFSEIKVDEDHR